MTTPLEDQPLKQAIQALETAGFECHLGRYDSGLWRLRWRRRTAAWECAAGLLPNLGELALGWVHSWKAGDRDRMAAYAAPGSLG